MLEEKDIFDNEFERQYGDSYRQGEGHCTPTHPENRFDEAPASVESLTPKTDEGASAEDAKELAQAVMPKDEAPVTAFGQPVADYINERLPNGAPEGSRHKFALKVASDVILLCDGNLDQVRRVLLSLPWVQDIVNERGMEEIERILQTAQKRMLKREAENYNEPQPSKEMRQAIKAVTGRSYSQLIREARLTAEGRELAAAEDDVMTMLENIGRDVEKLFPYFPVLQLLCHHLKRRHYIAALLVGAAFFMTLMTRCWYRSGMEPGRICRLNSILELIGRSGTGKHIAVDLYRLLMEPIKKFDKAETKGYLPLHAFGDFGCRHP